MKICNHCGYRNWAVVFRADKRPICSNCNGLLYEGSTSPVNGKSLTEGNFIRQVPFNPDTDFGDT